MCTEKRGSQRVCAVRWGKVQIVATSRARGSVMMEASVSASQIHRSSTTNRSIAQTVANPYSGIARRE
eukprot:11181998-Lingulodinium_polyedra.AAC.1